MVLPIWSVVIRVHLNASYMRQSSINVAPVYEHLPFLSLYQLVLSLVLDDVDEVAEFLLNYALHALFSIDLNLMASPLDMSP